MAGPRRTSSLSVRGKNSAPSCAKASWMTGKWKWTMRDRSMPSFEVISSQGVEEMDINIKDILPGLFGQRTKKRRLHVAEAMEYLIQEEENRLIDMDQVTRHRRGARGTVRYYLSG